MASDDRTGPDARPGLTDLTTGLGYLTRLSFLPTEWQNPPASRAAAAVWTLPIVGAGIGLIGGIVLIIAVAVGVSSLVGGLLAVLTTAALTGAIHEHGLAATADGTAGANPVERLALMAFGRPGTRGILALILSVMLRAGVLGGLAFLGEGQVLLLVIATESLSRSAMVRPWRALPAAGSVALPSTFGIPDERGTTTAIAIGVLIAAIAGLIVIGFWPTLVAIAGTVAVTLAFETWCKQKLGGQTPDALGACQQVAAITYLMLALAFS